MTQENKHIKRYPTVTLAAVLLFAAATFQIANDNTLLGVIFFGAASCFSSLAGILRERETHETSIGTNQ